MLAGAAVAGIDAAVGWTPGHWLALHLVFVGGVSQLVLGAGQFFAGAFLATDPPRRWLVRLQLGAWNAGTVLVAVGVPADVAPATIAGSVLLAIGLGAFVAGLDGLRRRSLQRAPWAVRWYEACAGFLGTGLLIGVLLATGVHSLGPRVGLYSRDTLDGVRRRGRYADPLRDQGRPDDGLVQRGPARRLAGSRPPRLRHRLGSRSPFEPEQLHPA
jgi:hypothetical protein